MIIYPLLRTNSDLFHQCRVYLSNYIVGDVDARAGASIH